MKLGDRFSIGSGKRADDLTTTENSGQVIGRTTGVEPIARASVDGAWEEGNR